MPARLSAFLLLASLAGLVPARSEEEPALYDSQGRRDPFVSLRAAPARPPGGGLSSFLIHEVALRGIVRTPRGAIVVLLGPDGRSYFARVGARLFDGTVAAVEGSTVTFRQVVAEPLSPRKLVEVRQTLED